MRNLITCPTCRLAPRCPESVIISLSVPIPWAEMVADPIHLQLSNPPPWVGLNQGRFPQSRDRALTNSATQGGFQRMSNGSISRLITIISWPKDNKISKYFSISSALVLAKEDSEDCASFEFLESTNL